MTPFGIMVLFSLLLNIILVDGSWGEWSPWSQCSRSCDGGTRSRVKLCDSPAPRNGGLACVGIRFEPEDCNSFPCKGKQCSHTGSQLFAQSSPTVLLPQVRH